MLLEFSQVESAFAALQSTAGKSGIPAIAYVRFFFLRSTHWDDWEWQISGSALQRPENIDHAAQAQSITSYVLEHQQGPHSLSMLTFRNEGNRTMAPLTVVLFNYWTLVAPQSLLQMLFKCRGSHFCEILLGL